jgi:uncharacterized protein
MHFLNITYISSFSFFVFFSISSLAGQNEAWAAMERGDYSVAVKEYQQLSAKGDPIAQAQLSLMFFLGEGLSKNIDEAQRLAKFALSNLETLAASGDPRAQVSIGSMYRDGRGVPMDESKAIEWYLKAAEQGSSSAQINIGLMHFNGLGVARDMQQVEVWVRKAAEQGHAIAQAALGTLYASREGIYEDDKKAVAWFRRSAEQGFVKGQAGLGSMYLSGRGIAMDDQQALIWFRKAAAQRDDYAQHSLGFMYLNGRGVPKDEHQAVEWFHKAAMQGNAAAQNDLGVMYFMGRVTPKNEQQAYFWWLLSSAKGDPNAIKSRDSAEKRLSREQIAIAQTAARTWKPGMSGNLAPLMQPFVERSTPPSRRVSREVERATPASTGSGFAVSPNQLITNAHVVDGCARVSLGGRGTATVLAMDKRNDLALLQADRLPVVASFREERLRQGDPIAVVGFPLAGLLASGAQVTSGNVSALAGLQNNSSFIQISAPVQPGNSGGPLLDTAGRVTGVVVSKLNAAKIAELTGDIPQNVNFAVSPLVLRGFLDANNVQYQPVSTNKMLSIADVTDMARKFTYLIQCWRQ